MRVPAYKISSFEITDIPLITYAAAKKKPMLISTGLATRREIEDAVTACRRVGNDRLILLKCTSAYPAPVDKMNLRMIPKLALDFKCLSGLSDHTLEISVPIAAAALGARVIEKHFILDRALGGPDAAFSSEPAEFAAMVRAVRETELSLGTASYAIHKNIAKNRVFCRSLFAVEDIRKGDCFDTGNVRAIRPSYGLPPKYLNAILGRRSACAIARGTPLTWRHIGSQRTR